MVAKRGIMFEFQTSVAPDADAAISALEKRFLDLQKVAAGIRIPDPVAARFANSSGANGLAAPPGSNGASGTSGSGSSGASSQPRAPGPSAPAAPGADFSKQEAAAKASARRLADIRREGEERERVRAEKTAAIVEKANQEATDQQIKDLKKAETERQKATAAEQREIEKVQRERKKALDDQMKAEQKFWDDAIKEAKAGAKARADAIAAADKNRGLGWKRLSGMGGDALRTSKKIGSGMEALSNIGRDAMRKADPFGEGLRRLEEERKATTGWAGLSSIGRDAPGRFAAARKREAEENKAADREAKRALRERKEAQQRVTEGINASLDAAMKLARGFTFLGLVGERDMRKLQDTLLAVQGTIDTIRGGIDTVRSIRGGLDAMRTLRAASGAAGLARGGAAAAGLVGAGVGAGGAGAAVGTGASGAAVAGGAVAAGGAGLALAAPAAILSSLLAARVAYEHATGQGNQGFASSRISKFNEETGITGAMGGLLHGISHVDRSLTGAQNEFTRANDAEKQTASLASARDRRIAAEQNREAIDASITPLEAERRRIQLSEQEDAYQARRARLTGRSENIGNQLGAGFGRQQAAFGDQLGLQQRAALGGFVDQGEAARAAANQAREEGGVAAQVARQQENLRLQELAASQRGQQINSDLTGARQRFGKANTESGKATEFSAIQAAEDKLKQNVQQRLEIQERIRQVAIEGAQRQLALNEQGLTAAKATASALREQNQSATERFGQLDPTKQRATLEAARAAAGGKQLQKPQLDLLRQFPELAGEFLRKQDTASAKAGGIDELKRLFGFDKRLAGAEAKEASLAKLVVDNRNEINLKLDANVEETADAVRDRIIPLLRTNNAQLLQEVDRKIQNAQWGGQQQAGARGVAAGAT